MYRLERDRGAFGFCLEKIRLIGNSTDLRIENIIKGSIDLEQDAKEILPDLQNLVVEYEEAKQAQVDKDIKENEEAFAANNINKPVPNREDLNYEEAVVVIKFGNDKYRKNR